MPKKKVTFLNNNTLPGRAELTMSLAPPDLEVTMVDADLPDEEKIPLCKDADALLVATQNVSVNLIRSCSSLKFIQLVSAGYDHLDIRAINEMGIPVASNGGSNAIAVAEHTIAFMIGVCKKMMLQWHNTAKERRWREGLPLLDMFEITEKTVGIVGLGRIGKQVAKRLVGFDTRTIYNDIVDMPSDVQRELKAQPVSFEELLHESDIVTLHVPLTPSTRGMIGDRELEMMKPSSFLFNTSRGPVVDESALYQALKNGRIAGAGLDVLETEPTPSDNPLFELDNVVITPHLAGLTSERFHRTAEFAYENIQRVLAGGPPESVITPDY